MKHYQFIILASDGVRYLHFNEANNILSALKYAMQDYSKEGIVVEIREL